MTYTATVRHEDGQVWCEVDQLPGCFAAADDVTRLCQVLPEVIRLYLTR